MSKEIDFSVVVPVFNTAPAILKECIDSILNQTVEQLFKVYIVNDGSDNQETLDYLKKLKKNKKITVFNLKENQGTSAALNHAHNQIKTEYVAICGSDDVLHPDKFKLQVEWLKEHPETSVLSTNLIGFKDSDAERKSLFSANHGIDCHPKQDRFWIANHGTVIYKNKDVKAAGLYDVAYRRGQDIDLWKRMYNMGFKFQCLPDVLYYWRRFID